MKRRWLLILACIALLSVAGWTKYEQKQSVARVQWEYKVVTLKEDLSEENLNALGSQGWEIIPLRTGDVDGKVIYYFKRQKL